MSARIKVCGLTRAEDAALAQRLGAWALGFIFESSSPRAIQPAAAGKILAQLGDRAGLRAVGVVVNAEIEAIRQAVIASGVDTVQLHGEESEDFCRRLRQALPRLQLFKALRPKSPEDLAQIPAYLESCEAILVDAYVPGLRGGTGVVGDWELAKQAASFGRVLLAGGLTPKNIQSALEAVGPYAVDASSGLEDSPGVKSEGKMREFFKNAGKSGETS